MKVTVQLTKSELNILLMYIQANMSEAQQPQSKSDVFSYYSLSRLYSKVLKKAVGSSKVALIDIEPDELLSFQELTKIVRENIYNTVINKIIMQMPVELIKIIENEYGVNAN
jgi:hypothetical protein